MTQPEQHGIWGGTLPETRRRAKALARERYNRPGVLALAAATKQDTPEVIAARRRLLLEATA